VATLVVQTSFLGDVILTTPLIAALAARGPVDVVTTLAGAHVLANNPAIRNTIVYEKRDIDRGLSGFTRIARRLRRTAGDRYDIAYLAQGSLRSALLALSAGIEHRVGFNTSAGRLLYSERVQYNPDRHHAERLWSLAYSDCADPPTPEQLQPRLYPGDDDRRVVNNLLTDAGIAGRFVVFAPGSVWGTKRWPFYPELATKIAGELQIVVVGGNADIEAGNLIVEQLPPGQALNAGGRLTLLQSAELIRRAAALVGNDSAPQHLASAMGTPTVTIYGPTTPAFGFGPLAPGSTTAGMTGLACRPCHPHGPARCPLGHWRCMRELSSPQVHEALMRTLSNGEQA
jgi:heptosyltransferase-2